MGELGSAAAAASAALLNTQDLQAVVVADGDPVGLSGGPLHVVDLALGCVGQDRVLDGTWHLLDVPDQSLVIIRYLGKGGGENTRRHSDPVILYTTLL